MTDARPPASAASHSRNSDKSELFASYDVRASHAHARDTAGGWRSWWCCCRRRAAAGKRRPSDGNALLDASMPRASGRTRESVSAPVQRSPEQLMAARQLKQQISHYSTMRVHMKRVQLCLEQEKRNKFYKELVVYLCFLAVVMAALLSLPVHFPFEQNSALENVYFDEEFPDLPYRKTFYDVGQEEELWEWVSGPMLYQFYESPVRNNRAIGSIQMRSGRVKGALCRETSSRNDFVMFVDEMCYPEFSTASEMTEPYGDESGVMGAQYQWTDDLGKLLRSQTFSPGLVNHQMDYGHGGYVVYLPRDNYTAATALVAQMQEDFLRDGTRYLVSSFAFYNARSNIFSHVQALFEMSNTDYMEVTGRIKSFRILASYKDTTDFVRSNVFVIVLLAATLALVSRELTDLRVFGLRKYVQSLWNLLDMLQLVLLVVFIAHWIIFLIKTENAREELYRVGDMDCSGPAEDQGTARDCFVDVEPLAWLSRAVTNYAAALALVSVAIVFKYLRLNSWLNLLWRTLRFAAKDLLAFVIIFFTIFFGFAVMGFLTFGTSVRQYHSLSVSLTSCFQMLLGAFDYEQIYTANPAMAGVFFFSFMVAIYLICVNMFIAIMSEYYSLAQTEKKAQEQSQRDLSQANGKGGSPDEDFQDSLQFTNVEYDVAKQAKNYLNGLRVRVKLPPQKNGPSVYSTEQLLLSGFQRVLLVDYDYLMAERRRLRRKFRACVNVVMTCYRFLSRNDDEFSMHVEHKLLDACPRPRAPSTDSYADLVEFPVTYLPIASALANTVEILQRVTPGTLIEMDDGSLTKDQITLEVLGGQDEYVPEHFRCDPIKRSRRFSSDDSDNDSGLDVRISEDTGDTDAHGSSSNRGPGQRFGLRHTHKDIGGPGHIRACRVLYNGDALLDGNETCLLPHWTWARYFSGFVLWGHVRAFFMCKKRKKKNRLVSDADVDRLITESFAAPGRGISCRFDELVRNFRMFIAKKVHKKHLRVPNLEERIFEEVITFVERFPTALTPLDKRELEGYKYTPQPINTKRIRLPHSINLLAELLSHNAHEVWAVGRVDQGWRWGPKRDNDTKLHPDLVPYDDLTEQDKQYDRDTSMSALKVITALGYVLEPPTRTEDFAIEFGTAAEEAGGTYKPRPIPTEDVKVPPHLRSVIELLAENTHEVWAEMRMQQGWKYGPQRDDTKKEHNGLVPYIYLTQDEKQMDRNTAMQTVKLILRCGFIFAHKDQRQRGAAKKKRSSGSFRMVGRNENPEAHNVGEAVALARGATRAKRAFMRNGRPVSSNRTSSAASLYSMSSSGSAGTPSSAASRRPTVGSAANSANTATAVAAAHARLLASTSSGAQTSAASVNFHSMSSVESADSAGSNDSTSNNHP